MNKDKILVLEEYNKERKGNIKYHEINKPESNPIFNFYFKK